jgi:hypothetical protein
MKKTLHQSELPREGDAWQEAERLGIDTSLLLANLRRTPLERIRAHDRALSTAMALRQAMREKHAWFREPVDTADGTSRGLRDRWGICCGGSLLTQDIDICCRFTPDNLMRLQDALADLHPVHRMTPKRLPLRLTPQTCSDLKNLYLDTDLGQLDCLGTITGVGDFEQAKARSVEITLPTGPCRVLSLDALIAAKAAMGRTRDREVVKQLKAIKARQDQRRDSGSEE